MKGNPEHILCSVYIATHQHEVVMAIMLTARMLSGMGRVLLKESGLTEAQFNILMLLQYQFPEGTMQVELSKRMLVNRANVTGLVDTGQLVALLGKDDAVAVMESIYRISEMKMGRVSTGLNFDDDPINKPGVSRDEVVKDLVECGYLKAADIADRFGNRGLFALQFLFSQFNQHNFSGFAPPLNIVEHFQPGPQDADSGQHEAGLVEITDFGFV